MKKLILLTGLLVALSGLIRSVDAQTSIVGYGSNDANEIRLVDLETGVIVPPLDTEALFDNKTYTVPFKGLAIDPAGLNLYGSDQKGNLYRIEIATGVETLLGNMGIIVPDKTGIEAMDFNADELWVTDFHSSTPTIYTINNFATYDPNLPPDPVTNPPISATFVQTVGPPGMIGGTVRTMVVDTITMTNDPTIDVWIANDSFDFTTFSSIMEFQSIDTPAPPDNPSPNVTLIGFLDDNPGDFTNPKIQGMDQSPIDGNLYGLAESGEIYSIDQESGLLTLIKDTDHVWLGLAATDADADAAPTTSTIKIALDIKPKHCPNKLYVKKKRKKKRILKAAILGTETFNVRNIEIYTIRLNGVEPKKYRYKDLTCPTVLNPCDCEALDADTFEDLVLYFKKRDIVDTLGDVHDGDEIPLTLIGKLTDGVTEIEGTDCVLIEARGENICSDDGSGHKKKWKKECKKKRHHGYGDNIGHLKKK